MEHSQAARCLEKLGNATRLEIFRLLVRAGPAGLAVGEIQEHLDIPGSTLSHHVSHLVNAGLVHQQREGRVLRCTPNFILIDEVIRFLTDECCAGVGARAPKRKAG
jgi:DNA-binding transcriptional ArsR family regulator